MAKTSRDDAEPTQDLRSLNAQNLEQARQAVDGLLSAAQAAIRSMDDRAATARKGATDLSRAMMQFAQRNIASSFELAQKLMRAKDVDEMRSLQTEYIKAQTQALAEQARELGERSVKAAGTVVAAGPARSSADGTG